MAVVRFADIQNPQDLFDWMCEHHRDAAKVALWFRLYQDQATRAQQYAHNPRNIFRHGPGLYEDLVTKVTSPIYAVCALLHDGEQFGVMAFFDETYHLVDVREITREDEMKNIALHTLN